MSSGIYFGRMDWDPLPTLKNMEKATAKGQDKEATWQSNLGDSHLPDWRRQASTTRRKCPQGIGQPSILEHVAIFMLGQTSRSFCDDKPFKRTALASWNHFHHYWGMPWKKSCENYQSWGKRHPAWKRKRQAHQHPSTIYTNLRLSHGKPTLWSSYCSSQKCASRNPCMSNLLEHPKTSQITQVLSCLTSLHSKPLVVAAWLWHPCSWIWRKTMTITINSFHQQWFDVWQLQCNILVACKSSKFNSFPNLHILRGSKAQCKALLSKVCTTLRSWPWGSKLP